ncbi:polysaccharide biosynthesis protein [Pontibacillus salicampi]|uniref:Polysaccharide biosynthesis protein n=1 Tax=Pontibacillus salicampi TaxID=1449801 RepID=A0ABV6LSF9_9BACI
MKGKTIFVTGGTGSWGNELVKQLLEKEPKEIRVFSRNESSQFQMKQHFNDHPSLTFIIGDVRDKEALINSMRGADYVYHLAALKHVPICEYQPLEAMKTNVLGTQYVVEAALINQVEKVMYISTDKAANPSNFYGMTKALGERLIVNANLHSEKTIFACVRGGNVLGTNGSVIHVFKDQIKHFKQIRMTDVKMSRFFLTIQEAIELLFEATEESKGGEIFVMKMPACMITDLADILIEHSGVEHVQVVETGIRPGEKVDEILLTEFESKSTIQYGADYYIILPSYPVPQLKNHYDTYPKANLTNYSSRNNIMNKEELKKLLHKGGFLS